MRDFELKKIHTILKDSQMSKDIICIPPCFCPLSQIWNSLIKVGHKSKICFTFPVQLQLILHRTHSLALLSGTLKWFKWFSVVFVSLKATFLIMTFCNHSNSWLFLLPSWSTLHFDSIRRSFQLVFLLLRSLCSLWQPNTLQKPQGALEVNCTN